MSYQVGCKQVLSQPSPRPARFKKSLAFAGKNICACLFICGIALFVPSPAHAQGGVPLVTVATDQSPLNLSNQFGIPAGSAINQAGDLAFVGNGDTALFFRAAGASAPTRLLQIEDQVPGFPDRKIRLFSPLVALNAAKLLLFEVVFTSSDDELGEALLTYDGANYHTVVSSAGIAPAPDSVAYGSLIPGSIDDQGDINFSAFLTGKSGITYYIVPSGGAAVRVAATTDTPPAACTWCSAPAVSPGGTVVIVGYQIVPSPLNKKGQMLLSLWGGLFIGSKDGLSLVQLATSGSCGPISNSVPSGTPAPLSAFAYGGYLNNLGAVAFTNPSNSASSICVLQPGGTVQAAIESGIVAPAGIGGGNLPFPVVLGMDDSGDIIFQSTVLGSSVTTFAILRYHPGAPQLDVVAYDGETAPGTTNGSTISFLGLPSFASGSIVNVSAISLSAFSSISMAKDGSVGFRAPLSKGGSAIYRQTGANTPEFLFLDGQPNSFIGFGIRALPFSPGVQTKILDNGSVFFSAYLTNGAADFAEFLGTPGKLQTLMSTADVLPSGARTILPATPPKAAGHFVAFTAQPAAGRNNLFVSDVTSGSTTRVVSDNDLALAAAGGAPGDTSLASNFFLNESGQLAFEMVDANASSRITFSSINFTGFANKVWSSVGTSNCGTIYLYSPPPAAGLTKIAAPGDMAPNTTTPYSCVALNAEAPSPLNRSGQVAFNSPSIFSAPPYTCFLCGGPPPTLKVNGTFLYSPANNGIISEIVAANDPLPLPGETQPATFVPAIPVPVNSTGQVGFGAQIGLPSSGFQRFFVRNADGTVQKVVSSGDTVPGSTSTFTAPILITGLDDNGNLTFRAATSTAMDGIFFAPAGGGIQTIALDGVAVPAAVGGTFALDLPFAAIGSPIGSFLGGTPFSSNIALANNESDVAFHSAIVGGSANSGYFLQMRSGGGLQPVVLQGQPAPGGGTFTTIESPGLAGNDFALGPDGALAFVAGLSTSRGKRGLFVARPDGNLVPVLATGDTVPGGGVLNSLALSHGLAAGETGKFAFWAGIDGGSARQAILVTSIPAGTASTTATLALPQSPVLALQSATIAAKVAGSLNGTAATVPTGNVNFFDDGISIGNGTLDSTGSANMTTSSLVAGPHSFVAQYSGDAVFAPADSPTVATVVTGFALAPTGLAVTAGQSLSIPLTLYAPSGSNSVFALSCSGTPANASCAFDQNQVTPGPTGTAIKVTLSTMKRSNLLPDSPRRGPGPLGLLELSAILSALLATAMTWLRQPLRRHLVFSACLAVFCLAAVMTGCGAVNYVPSVPPGPSGTPAGPAAITVTATSGATTVSTVVHVTVQ
jgi:hypothetical protein